MNILYIYTDYFKNYDLPIALKSMGHKVDIIEDNFSTIMDNESLNLQLEDKLRKTDYFCVMSYGFCPDVSSVCEKMKILYVAWTYDSLCMALYHGNITNSYSHIFIFDYSEWKRLKDKYPNANIYHLPLGVNSLRIDQLEIQPSDREKYGCPIAFVGTMYNHNEFDEIISYFQPSDMGYFEDVFGYFRGKWNGESIYDWFSADEMVYFNQKLPEYAKNDSDIDDRLYYAFTILNRKLGQLDRIDVLNKLSDLGEVHLFTPEEDRIEGLDKAHRRFYVNYYDEMYKVFALSKININITLRGIKTGIPLRCMDILGARGFLLSSYQQELGEVFQEGKEIEMFRDLHELQEKTRYYLTHEEERQAICDRGYEKIKSCHTYVHRIEEMFREIQKNV